jgi:hypothetical protein
MQVAMPPPTEQGSKPSTPSQASGEEGQLRIFRLTLRSDRPILGTATGVRGFFGTRFPGEVLLHQHIPGEGRTLYQYPKVQYRIAGGEVTAIGIAEGAAALGRVYDQFDEIRLGLHTFSVMERQGEIVTEPFGLTETPRTYRFATPWLPLSQKNLPIYSQIQNRALQTAFLERILIGNLISASKSLRYEVPGRIVAALQDWGPVSCEVKGMRVIGVRGEFAVNFAIPDDLGIGRSVSRGHGAVRAAPPG